MTLAFSIAIYLLIWWLVLFAMLPIGVHTQADEGEVAPGTAESAPLAPRLLLKMLATTVISGNRLRGGLRRHRASCHLARRHSLPAALRNHPLIAERGGGTKKSKVRSTLLFSMRLLGSSAGELAVNGDNRECWLRAAAPVQQHHERAWSYFLPRLGPGPISTRDFRDRYRPRTLSRCVGTLARLRQIVTIIVTVTVDFLPQLCRMSLYW